MVAVKKKHPPGTTLGILAFDTAKTISRLVSLYKSVSDEEIHKLRTEIIRSVGVSYLNSDDETFLLGLACSERVEELNRVAATVSRLGKKCSDQGLNRFDQVYADLKQGTIDAGKFEFGGKVAEKIIGKMEKYVATTSALFAEMEGLKEMEVQERRILQWRAKQSPEQAKETNYDLFEQKIGFQRKEVRRYKQISLWNKTFDKCVGLMARVICTVYARFRVVFGPNVSVLTDISVTKGNKKHHHFHIHLHRPRHPHSRIFPETDHRDLEQPYKPKRFAKSGPIPKQPKKETRSRFWSHELNSQDDIGIGPEIGLGTGPEMKQSNRVYLSAPPTTVGGSGLALRYANVILIADNYLNSPAAIGDEDRGMLYDMIPARLKATVRTKLRSNWVRIENETQGVDGKSLAAGWREAAEGMMEWLAPVAVDTMRWQAERNVEKQNMDSKPKVLLLQTLHYSDLEKTEAAIVEVLVGLSFINKYENRQTLFFGAGGGGGGGGGDYDVGFRFDGNRYGGARRGSFRL